MVVYITGIVIPLQLIVRCCGDFPLSYHWYLAAQCIVTADKITV